MGHLIRICFVPWCPPTSWNTKSDECLYSSLLLHSLIHTTSTSHSLSWSKIVLIVPVSVTKLTISIHKYLNTDGKFVDTNPWDCYNNSWWRNWSLRNQGLDESWSNTISWTKKNWKNNQNGLLPVIMIVINIFRHPLIMIGWMLN